MARMSRRGRRISWRYRETRADAVASALGFSKCGRISGIICYLNYYFLLLQ